jgi:hypothetical protein
MESLQQSAIPYFVSPKRVVVRADVFVERTDVNVAGGDSVDLVAGVDDEAARK